MIQMLKDVIKDAQKLPKMIHELCALLPLLLAPEFFAWGYEYCCVP